MSHLKFLQLQWGPKIQNLIILTKGFCRLEIMRGFHIWYQNLNRTAFDPLFGQKMVENGILAVFNRFLAKNGVKCC